MIQIFLYELYSTEYVFEPVRNGNYYCKTSSHVNVLFESLNYPR